MQTFLVGSGDYLGIDFPLGKFSMGMEVSKGELSRGNFTEEELVEIHIQNLFHSSYFHVGDPILHVWNVAREKFSAEKEFSGKFSCGGISNGRISPCGKYYQEKLTLRKFSTGEEFSIGGVVARKNFYTGRFTGSYFIKIIKSTQL